MSTRSKYCFASLLVSFFCSAAVAEVNPNHQQATPISITVAETADLKAQEGYTGNQLGAQVKTITVDKETDTRFVEVHIPFDPDKADRIQVVTESDKLLAKDRIAEVLKDYENGNIGIKFYLPKQKNWSFKIKLIDDADDK